MTAVLDAGVAIGFIDPSDRHARPAQQALARLVKARAKIRMSTVTLAEVLVAPMRSGEEHVNSVMTDLSELLGVELVGVDSAMALEVAAARARNPKLKLPDAAVVATAQVLEAEMILTTDRDFSEVKSAVLLKDFVSD